MIQKDILPPLEDMVELFTSHTEPYCFGGVSRVHRAAARYLYLVGLAKIKQHLLQYSIMWDIALFVNGDDQSVKIQDVFEELLEHYNLPKLETQDIATFMLFDSSILKGNSEVCIAQAVELTGIYPIKKEYCKHLFKKWLGDFCG